MAFRDEAMNGYTAEEAGLVETAKRTHRATTESAQRALSVRICRIFFLIMRRGDPCPFDRVRKLDDVLSYSELLQR